MINHNNFFYKEHLKINSKETYVINESIKEDINILSNDSYIYKIDSQASYINNILLDIKIPYFLLSKIITETSSSSQTNNNYSSILYNNSTTFLVKIDEKYYLLPN